MKINVKKIRAVLIISAVLIMLTACGNGRGFGNGKKSIVCTSYVAYDWTMQVLGDTAADYNIKLLVDNGADMHSYQPSAMDIALIIDSDLFIYVGGESESWVLDVVRKATKKDVTTICMLDFLGDNAIYEEELPGIDEEEASDDDEHEREYDEHVWLSLKNAKLLVEEISAKLCEMDSEKKDIYKTNAEKYISQLDSLDKEYMSVVSAATQNTILFGDRFPFLYLTRDYGISYYAAFEGCSAETEASFETITFLAKKVDELNLKSILVIDGSDEKLAGKIKDTASEADIKILSIDSIQAVSKKQIDEGYNYLEAMRNNLLVLEIALEAKLVSSFL